MAIHVLPRMLSESGTAASKPADAPFSMLARFARAAAQELRLRRDIATLAQYDDVQLRDIGLDRGSIDEAVRHGRAR